MSQDEGRPGDRGGPHMTAKQGVTLIVADPVDVSDRVGRTSQPERTGQTWARQRMSEFLARVYADDGVDNGPWCSGWHPGPCDFWSVCTGASMGILEREAAGAEHPWRCAA